MSAICLLNGEVVRAGISTSSEGDPVPLPADHTSYLLLARRTGPIAVRFLVVLCGIVCSQGGMLSLFLQFSLASVYAMSVSAAVLVHVRVQCNIKQSISQSSRCLQATNV